MAEFPDEPEQPAGLSDMSEFNRPSVDFLILADRAEVVNGKLYVMGGAWDRIFAQDLRNPSVISLAIGILVPWLATNQQHSATIGIEDADGVSVGFQAEVGFNTGRPAGAEVGEAQRVLLAIPSLAVQFPRYGRFYVQAYINGHQAKRVTFQVAQPLGGAPPIQA